MLEAVVSELRAQGELDNTYIFFSSDNGFHMGQHRFTQGKETAYEEDIAVPMIVRGPGVPADATRQQPGPQPGSRAHLRRHSGRLGAELRGRALIPVGTRR